MLFDVQPRMLLAVIAVSTIFKYFNLVPFWLVAW